MGFIELGYVKHREQCKHSRKRCPTSGSLKHTTPLPKYPLWALPLHELPSANLSVQALLILPSPAQILSPPPAPPASWKKGVLSSSERPMHVSPAVLWYGCYNHALNKTENKRAVHVVKHCTDANSNNNGVLLSPPQSGSCMSAGITFVTFVSPIVLHTIRL